MSNEIKNMVAVELSDAELDNVAGGFGIIIGGGQNLALGTFSGFSHKTTTVAQETFTGFGGSYTGSLVHVEETKSSAGQTIAIG